MKRFQRCFQPKQRRCIGTHIVSWGDPMGLEKLATTMCYRVDMEPSLVSGLAVHQIGITGFSPADVHAFAKEQLQEGRECDLKAKRCNRQLLKDWSGCKEGREWNNHKVDEANALYDKSGGALAQRRCWESDFDKEVKFWLKEREKQPQKAVQCLDILSLVAGKEAQQFSNEVHETWNAMSLQTYVKQVKDGSLTTQGCKPGFNSKQVQMIAEGIAQQKGWFVEKGEDEDEDLRVIPTSGGGFWDGLNLNKAFVDLWWECIGTEFKGHKAAQVTALYSASRSHVLQEREAVQIVTELAYWLEPVAVGETPGKGKNAAPKEGKNAAPKEGKKEAMDALCRVLGQHTFDMMTMAIRYEGSSETELIFSERLLQYFVNRVAKGDVSLGGSVVFDIPTVMEMAASIAADRGRALVFPSSIEPTESTG